MKVTYMKYVGTVVVEDTTLPVLQLSVDLAGGLAPYLANCGATVSLDKSRMSLDALEYFIQYLLKPEVPESARVVQHFDVQIHNGVIESAYMVTDSVRFQMRFDRYRGQVGFWHPDGKQMHGHWKFAMLGESEELCYAKCKSEFKHAVDTWLQYGDLCGAAFLEEKGVCFAA